MPVLRPVVLTPRRVRLARWLAVAVDAVQIVGFPAFGEGFASPWNDALDFVATVLFTALVGWHWAFLPSLVVELLPGFDLVPTWTAAVLLATRGRRAPPAAGPAVPAPPESVR